jgi:hypothetical protein
MVHAKTLLGFCFVLATAPLAHGLGDPVAQHYVDVNAGSDFSGNGTPGAPWRTITHALNATTGFRRIHAAAGEYSTLSGESFPLALSPEAYVLGAGRGQTVIRGTSGQVLVAPSNAAGLAAYHPLLESVTLSGLATGVLATGPSNPLGVVDVEFDNMLQGVWILEDGLDASLNVERSLFHGCLTGVHISGFGHAVASIADSRIESGGVAFQIDASSGPAFTTGASEVFATRTIVRQNFRVVQMSHASFQDSRLYFSNSLITGNALIAVCNAPAGAVASDNLIECYWSTLADNGGLANASALATSVLQLWGSILWNSGTSIDPDLAIEAWRTNTDLPVGGALVTSLAPKFDALAPGEYRLAFDSPLIDLYANYPYPQPTTDFEGDPRALDFDGDGSKLVDVGWDERSRLLLLATGAAKLGTTVGLTTHGPAGMPICTLLSGGITALELDAGNWVLIQLAPAWLLGCAIAPASAGLYVPNDLSLLGVQAWIQAGGLQGSAIQTSNRIALTIE